MKLAKRSQLTLFLISPLFLSSVFAQILPLDSVLAAIESRNPEIKMFDAQIKAMNSYATGAKSWDAPQVATGFFMTPYNRSMWQPDPSMYSSGMGSYMISVQQMIPNAGKLNANKTYMESMSTVETQNKLFVRNKLFADAKTSYYELVVLLKKQKVLSESETLLKFVIQTTELRYPYNQEKLGSIYKGKAQLAEIQSMLLMIRNEANQKEVMLNTLMNRNKTAAMNPDTSYVIKNYELDLADTTMISTQRSDLKAIDNTITSLKAKQKFEDAKRLPDFGLKYDHMFTFGNQPQLFSLMGMITIPIAPWSSKMYKSSVTGLGYEMQALQSQKQSIVNEANGQLQALKIKIGFQKQQLILYEKSILPALRKNYQVLLLSYEQNTEDLFMVLDAIQMLKMNQLAYLDQLEQLLTLQTEYEKEIERR
ncbi:MAG: TolC family protein [bacterium]|nr:TolC family protein [bacterium]